MAEICEVCGQEYGMVHDNCPGEPPPPEPSAWIAPIGFSPGFYLRQALAIIRLDDDAIVSASRDTNALYYGAFIWSIACLMGLSGTLYRAISQAIQIDWLRLASIVLYLIGLNAAIVVCQYGLTHFIALKWLGAKGRFIGIVRTMWMGSMVQWLVVIPVIGTLVSGLWSICILMKVFEEVDRIDRLRAFALAFVSGLLVQGLARSLFGS